MSVFSNAVLVITDPGAGSEARICRGLESQGSKYVVVEPLRDEPPLAT